MIYSIVCFFSAAEDMIPLFVYTSSPTRTIVKHQSDRQEHAPSTVNTMKHTTSEFSSNQPEQELTTSGVYDGVNYTGDSLPCN